jgi:hypothetical protein
LAAAISPHPTRYIERKEKIKKKKKKKKKTTPFQTLAGV